MSFTLRNPTAWILGLLATVAVAGCSDDPMPIAPEPEPVAAVFVTPAVATLEVGATQPLQATIEDAKGGALVGAVKWRSSAGTVATVDANGLVSAVAAGTAVITAVSDGVAGSATIQVLPPVAAVDLTPATAMLLPGQTLILGATLRDAAGGPVVRAIEWRSGDPAVATVDGRGIVAAVAPGIATITGTAGSASGTATITVRAPVNAVVVSPANATVTVGTSLPLGVTVLDPAGKQLAVPVTWLSTNPSVASVSAEGVVTAVAVGTATVAATVEGRSGFGAITVVAAVGSVAVSPAVAYLDVDEQLQLAAAVADPAGQDLDRTVSWVSSDPAIATIDAAGRLVAKAAGIVTITATVDGKSATAKVTVHVPVAEVEVPAVAKVDVGGTLTITATPTDANGVRVDRPVMWTSSDPTVATVDANGVVRALKPGTATIAARAGTHTSWTTVTVVTPVTVLSITPATGRFLPGGTVGLVATLRDERGNPIAAGPFEWRSSNPAVATVDAKGVVSFLTEGVVVVTATSGAATATAQFESRIPVATVAVLPLTATVPVGKTVSLAATPKSAAGKVLARTVVWTSRNPAIATVNGGTVTAVAVGTATIVATADEGSGTATITVVPPVASITIGNASSQPLHVDSTLQLTATAADASGNPLPGQTVTWTSSDVGVATVTATGLVTGIGRGTATITASVGSVSATASIRVVGHATTTGNNLSYPVVFAEGIGITGLSVAVDAGLRPTPAESIAVTGLPFFYSGNVPDYNQTYYLQQGSNVWQADWRNGLLAGMQQAEVAWSDNLTHHSWNTHSAIRVEIGLTAFAHPMLAGYNMTVLYGSGSTEMQGTDGTTALAVPLIYSVMPRLVIERLDDVTRTPVATVFNGAVHEWLGIDGPGGFGAEINVGGKIIYGYNLMLKDAVMPSGVTKYGWYRLSFQLDNAGTVNGAPVSRNTALARLATSTDSLTYTPVLDVSRNVTWLDIYVTSASGGHD